MILKKFLTLQKSFNFDLADPSDLGLVVLGLREPVPPLPERGITELLLLLQVLQVRVPGSEGSVGEGPNQTKYSDQNSWNLKKTTKSYFIEVAFDPKHKPGLFRSEFFQNSGIFARNYNKFRKIQHFLNYWRNSDKTSSKSEQKSPKRIQK